MNKQEIVCLCGSTKFKKEFERIILEETLKGRIVLSVGWFSHTDGYLPEEQVKKLKEMHLRKIEIADLIKVVTVDNYIGDGLKDELEYAKKLGKRIE